MDHSDDAIAQLNDAQEFEFHENDDVMDDGDEPSQSSRVYLPGDSLKEGEELVMDTTAYLAFCEFTAEWPCLSFDVLPDALGDARTTFPMSCQLVVGTQAEKTSQNSISVLQVSNITKINNNDDDDEEEEDEEQEDPLIQHSTFRHRAGVNRLRVCPQSRNVVAVWSDNAHVNVFNIQESLNAVEQGNSGTAEADLMQSHRTSIEGYAVDWSTVTSHRLATGDCSGALQVWNPQADGSWAINTAPDGHTDSIEDIQWSPSEPNVLASCSVDKTIRIWDIRSQLKPVLSVPAHDVDVNVLSWNKREQHLLVSGGDDGLFKVWDLRSFMSGNAEAVASFKWHSGPITSVEWHPTDASVIAVAGADNQVSLWDMAVEEEQNPNQQLLSDGKAAVPAQLLFVHQGQQDVKEIHWHPQLPGTCISTAGNGFNIFKSISV